MTLLERLSPILIRRLGRFLCRRTPAGDNKGEGQEVLDLHRIPEISY
jgi:hypothetical protein